MIKKKNYVVLLLIFSVFAMDVISVLSVTFANAEESNIVYASTPESAAVNMNIGAWILVAGDRESDHALYYAIEEGVQDVYDILINIGYSASNIYFLAGNWDGSLPADASAESTKANIEYAITTWADGKVNSVRGLGIFLFDHGGINSLSLPGPNLSPTELDAYLTTLETSTLMTRSLIVYEACHAGSFIDPVSKSNRIVVTATSSALSSYPNADLSGAVFTDAFWFSIAIGRSVGRAFEDATAHVKAVGLGASQKPWIDDNHDEIGHEVSGTTLPNGGDGTDALNVYIGVPDPYIIGIFIVKLFLPKWVPQITTALPIWVVVHNVSELEYIRVRIIPPGWVPPEPRINDPVYTRVDPDAGIAYFTEDDILNNFPYFDLTPDPENPENFSKTIDPNKYPDIFGDDGGEYQTVFMAKTKGTHQIAKVESSRITFNDDGVAPPDQTPPSISLTNLSRNVNLSGQVQIIAKGDDDQELDKVQILLDGAIIEEKVMTTYPYPDVILDMKTSDYTDGEHNITAVAFDKSGNKNQETVLVKFSNSVIPGFPTTVILFSSFVGVLFIIIKRKKSISK